MFEETVLRSIPPGKFTCPMHPEVRAENPGACPKCGMTLEPVDPASTGLPDLLYQ
jgi:Cu+-exporting ATPase